MFGSHSASTGHRGLTTGFPDDIDVFGDDVANFVVADTLNQVVRNNEGTVALVLVVDLNHQAGPSAILTVFVDEPATRSVMW